MANTTIDITQPFDRPQKLLRMLDNGDGTYSVAVGIETGDGLVSTGNTTEVNLAGGATFDGAFENVLPYGAIRVAIYSSHASATRGLEFWCSKDGVNGFMDDSYTIPAATPKTFAVPVSAPYFKIKYTNGGTQTTTLNICVIYQKNVSVASSHRLGDTVTDNDDAQLVKAVLSARKPNGDQTNIDATAGGNLKVSLEELEPDVTVPVIFPAANLSAFDTIEVSELTPVAQGDFYGGLNKTIWQYYYKFTTTEPVAHPVNGDIYTNNNGTFVVIWSSGTSLLALGSSAPAASGNLVRSTGSGSTPIAYSAFTQQAGVTFGTGATIDTNASRLRLQSGTATDGYSYITLRRPIRYRAGQGTTVRFTPLFSNNAASNLTYWGIGYIVNNALYDGYFIGYNGTTFSIVHYNRGTPSATAQADWNGDLNFTINKTYGNVFQIKFPFLGYGDILFQVQNPDTGRFVTIHKIKYANSSADTQLASATMNFMGFTKNSGNTTNITSYCGSYGVFVSGKREYVSNPKWAVDSTKSSVTTEANIVSLRNSLSYNGSANRGLMRLHNIAVGITAAVSSTVIIRFKYNVALGGTPAYAAINGTTIDNGVTLTAADSVGSFDTAGTTITGGQYIFNLSFSAGQNGSGGGLVDLTPFDIFIAPGEIMTISAVSPNNATISVSINGSDDT